MARNKQKDISVGDFFMCKKKKKKKEIFFCVCKIQWIHIFILFPIWHCINVITWAHQPHVHKDNLFPSLTLPPFFTLHVSLLCRRTGAEEKAGSLDTELSCLMWSCHTNTTCGQSEWMSKDQRETDGTDTACSVSSYNPPNALFLTKQQ